MAIEDDPTTQALIKAALPNFDVLPALSLAEAGPILERDSFSALVVDIELPDGDGLSFLSRHLESGKLKSTPILVLSSHSEVSSKVMAFTLGADDFLAKPFDPLELHARVTSKIKKMESLVDQPRVRELGDLLIDFSKQKAFRRDKSFAKDLALTGIELKMLELFTRHLDQVYSRNQIMDLVWGETFISDRTVDSHVAHLRKKLAGSRVQIKTAKSFGYFADLSG